MLQPRVLVRLPPLQVDQLDQHAQLPRCSTVGLVAKREIVQINKQGPRNASADQCVCRIYALRMFSLTWALGFIALEILAAQAFKQMRAHADALSIQQRESGSVMTRLTLAHVVLGHVVRRRLFQVGNLGVGTGHFDWN